MKTIMVVSFLTMIAAFCACSNDSVMNPAQPLAPTFTNVEMILNNSCAFTGCHGSTNPNPIGGVMVLEISDNDASYGQIVNVPSVEQPQLKRVRPFQPDSSYLLKKLRGDKDIVGARMPFCCQPLAPGTIAIIQTWIAQGALIN